MSGLGHVVDDSRCRREHPVAQNLARPVRSVHAVLERQHNPAACAENLGRFLEVVVLDTQQHELELARR
jgi:hypothetical protein